MTAAAPVLAVEGLTVRYGQGEDSLRAVHDVSFTIAPGEAYGLIGESGSGKSTIAFAIVNHIRGGTVETGSIRLRGRDLLALPRAELARLRGRRVAMVYQDPHSALNPAIPVGEQIAEAIRQHHGASHREAEARTAALLARVHLPEPELIARRYAHQISGGQQQRVVIAMALACEPDLLIMDEPTTGLDVTTEAVILDLIAELRRSVGVAILFISHNLGVVARVCDRVGVLYAGEMMEQGETAAILRRPRNPYTRGLLSAIPRRAGRRDRLAALPGGLPDLSQEIVGCVFAPRCAMAGDRCRTEAPALVEVAPGHLDRCHFAGAAANAPVAAPAEAREATAAEGAATRDFLRLNGIARHFAQWDGLWPFARRRVTTAVDGVSLEIAEGETLAVVGESGSGKSTLAKCIMGLLAPSAGHVELDGAPVGDVVQARSREARRALQIVFQNPEASLNPAHRVEEILARPLRLYGLCREAEIPARVRALLAAVKLGDRYLDRYPRELSGGEKQRVCIARAFAASPRIVVCDEPTSALDISVQAALLNELVDLQRERGTSYLFISHDLGVVRYISHRVAVMYLGRVVETGPTEAVFAPPHHPYTEALISALPSIDDEPERGRIRLDGRPHDLHASSRGCAFHTRCPRKIGAICETEAPPARRIAERHWLHCHIAPEELARLQASGRS
ncbi:MAG: ABC transporter ATP-binding protein [Alphaproteobacteria bacterium]|nr:ABC transporter ATP-binding protein [Alphaproteobacteria bacterium]